MSLAELSHQLRSLLEELTEINNQPLSHVLVLVDSFVQEISSSSQLDTLLDRLDDELLAIHRDIIDHTSLHHTEVFLFVLYRLCPVLSACSLIGTWFDLILRPALREPRLSDTAVNYAKELIIAALQKCTEHHMDKIGEFRRRLVDLYLLDAYNEGSGDDVVEWASLDQEQRTKRTCWKHNLEHTLTKYGLEQPEDLFTEINHCFATPSSRLQLLMLINCYASQPLFSSHATVLADHPLMSSLLLSLSLDNSSTVCVSGLTVLSKLLPIFAVYATERLKSMLPQLLAILARMICWKERQVYLGSTEHSQSVEDAEESEAVGELEPWSNIMAPALRLRPDLDWEPLEMIFVAAASSAPSPHQYFTYLYYLFPCNTIRFLRGPVDYLSGHGVTSLYTVPLDEVLDEDEIKTRSEPLLRGHILHPLLLWSDADEELAQPRIWSQYDVSRIVGECTMLDVRNASLGLRAKEFSPEREPEHEQGEDMSTPTIHMIDLSTPGRPRISMREMIATSLALKSVQDVAIVDTDPGWPSGLFPSASTSSPSKQAVSLPPELNISSSQSDGSDSHVAQAISALQREVLLLRNELNFELWINKENAKHIGHLHQDRIMSRNAEMERQGLHNKLREYKAQVNHLSHDLKQYKEQMSAAKEMYADWNTEQKNKLRGYREQGKSWQLESTILRNENKDAKATLEAQDKLLTEAMNDVFQLKTTIKENQHKIDRLKDYERRIEQLTNVQRLWDEDATQFNQQTERMEALLSAHKKMELRIEAYEKTQAEMENTARASRLQVQELQGRLCLAQDENTARQRFASEVAMLTADRASLLEANAKLREENGVLRDEVQELEHMLEMLKAQVSGKRGLVSERPITPPLMS